MALDLHNTLANMCPDTVIAEANKLAIGDWTVLSSGGVYNTLYRFAGSSNGMEVSKYRLRESLEANGVLAIAGRANLGPVSLNGGSICHTELQICAKSKVIKRTRRSLLQEQDAVERHESEAGWMQSFQILNTELFPKVTRFNSNHGVSFELDFFPAYSLGELLMEGTIDLDEIKNIISDILSACSLHLYSRKINDVFENYIEKVSRRLEHFLGFLEDSTVVKRLIYDGGLINGLECRPLVSLLNECKANPTLQRFITCQDARLCHGDLIPEDILYSRYYRKSKLIDPNPQISDPLADFAKLQMSFELNYELALRDLIYFEPSDATGILSIHTIPSKGYENYLQQQSLLAQWLPRKVREFVPSESREAERFIGPAIRLIAALQALALPVFHAMQHKRIQRAVYFFVKGHEMLERAIADAAS